jgi:hypothetical protein
MQILNPSTTPAYSGVIRNTVQIARTEGFFSLWRGMSSVIVGAGKSTTSWPGHKSCCLGLFLIVAKTV